MGVARNAGRVLIPVLLMACGGDARAPEPVPPPAADPAAAVIFAPAIVSTAAPEFSVTFSPDGRSAWFNRTPDDRTSLTILETHLVDGAWTEPVPASFSGTHRDIDPFVTGDGSRLYFNSDRPAGPGDTTNDFDTWFVERSGDGWGAAQRLSNVYNSDSSETFVSATRDGTLYFRSDRDGTRSVYAVTPAGERRIVAIETTQVVSNPLVDPDGRFLIVAITTEAGPPDLYVACRSGDGFAAPLPLDGVNSPFAEFAPALSPDGRTFYFTSERPGQAPPRTDGARPPGDIWSIPVASLGIDCPM